MKIFCGVVLAAFAANAIAAAVDAWVLHRAGLRAVIVYATPWDTPRERLKVRTREDLPGDLMSFGAPAIPEDEPLIGRALRADGLHQMIGGWFAAAAVLVALSVRRPRVIAGAFVVFAAARLASHELMYETNLWYQLATGAKIGAFSVIAALVAAIFLARTITWRDWLFGALPACAFLALMSPVQRVAAAMFAVASLIAACLSQRVPSGPAPLSLRVITALVLALSLPSRAVVIRTSGIRVQSFPEIRAGIERDWPLSLLENAP